MTSEPSPNARPLAVVTCASSGIGFELAKLCASNGFDLVIAADEPLNAAADVFRRRRAAVETVERTWRPCPASIS